MGYEVEIGVSNKHLHLSEADLATLFGDGYKLTVKKDLKQSGQYAAEEQVDVVGPKGTIKAMRILGPTRRETQVELAQTDARGIGLSPPVRESGDLEGSPGIKLIGPKGEINTSKGVIVALRHIHLSPGEAEKAGVKDKDWVTVRTKGTRPLIFENVLIRSIEGFFREFHIDTDEANAAGVVSGEFAEIISNEPRRKAACE